MRDPDGRKPTYRTTPASQPWHREHDANFYVARHAANEDTPREQSVPAIRERHGRGA